MAVKVFGHKIPDTDSVVSAIVFSWYLNKTGTESAPYALGKLNKETLYVLNYFSTDVPDILEGLEEGDKIAIVDTNNANELIDLSNAEILHIVDHHKLFGNISTPSPVNCVIKPVASTSTILYLDYISKIEDKEEIPKNVYGLILAGILSDTLEFRSPTTTQEDRDVANKIADILGINISEFAIEMFKAKSDISDISDKDLVLLDSKVFEINDTKLRVSVVESANPQTVLDRKTSIIETIDNWEEDDVDLVLFFVVDILNNNSVVFIQNERVKQIVEKAFEVSVDSDTVLLEGVVSRKKQIIPRLESSSVI